MKLLRDGVQDHSVFPALLSCIILIGVFSTPVWSQVDESEQIRVIQEEIHKLESMKSRVSVDPTVLTKLARLYLKLGDMSHDSTEQRITIYEEGTRLAKQAMTINEDLADAHFYYAANLGSATQLQGVMASAFVVRELKSHAKRAVELQSDHAPALHMLGRMLDELPRLLGGDQDAALKYMQKSVSVDENDVHARLDLAKLYLKRKNSSAARKELQKILRHTSLEQDWSWKHRIKPEAERLLEELGNQRSSMDSR